MTCAGHTRPNEIPRELLVPRHTTFHPAHVIRNNVVASVKRLRHPQTIRFPPFHITNTDPRKYDKETTVFRLYIIVAYHQWYLMCAPRCLAPDG